MKEPIRVFDNQKWQAVVSCDSNYNGIFFYGAKTIIEITYESGF